MKTAASNHSEPSGLSLSPKDIYYILFRHKWKILIFIFLGLGSGAATYLLWPESYYSQAQILVKYVTENREVISENGATRTLAPGGRGNTVMGTEAAILSSMDLAIEVDQDAQALKNSLPPEADPAAAINPSKIRSGLTVDIGKGSNILNVSFNHANRELAKPLLQQVIDTYLDRHFAIHQDRGAFDDFLIQQTDQAKARLMQTEEELINARRKAGVISVEQARETLISEISRLRQLTNDTKTEIAASQAIYDELAGRFESIKKAATAEQVEAAETPSLSEEEVAIAVREFERKRTQLEVLRTRERTLLSRFTPESSRYKALIAQLEATEAELYALRDKYPTLFAATDPTETASTASPEEAAREARLQQTKIASLQSRLQQLNTQMEELQNEAVRLDQVELTMKDLTRRKNLEESNYRVLLANLEKNRLTDAQDSNRVSNLTILQSPTNPSLAQSVKVKVAGGVAGGIAAIGLAWAFLVELLLDQSIKRPSEVRKFLGVPLFLTLPDTRSKAFKKLSKKSSPEQLRLIGRKKADDAKKKNKYKPVSGTLQAAAKAQPELYGTPDDSEETAISSPWDDGHDLHHYFEALRDKVISYFESRNLTHTPKLIGMTGIGKEPGVTTIASGLASSLSKTEGGNVLLVDMTLGQESAQQFYKGKAVGNIDEALEDRGKGQISDNLFVVAEGSNGYKLPSILPRRFNSIIPKLKASDFDYIIFDMPAVSPISSTPRLASFMDITLMVMESEETNRDVAKQAAELLAESNVQLGAILNKTKSYVPKQLEQDFVGLS